MTAMKTKNLPLLIGIALPLVFIIIVAFVVFSPSFFIKPQYNFIYVAENSNYVYNQQYSNTYKVEDNHITLEKRLLPENVTSKGEAPTLYLYDVKTNSSRQISFEEAKSLFIDVGPSSLDGYTVSYEYGHSGIFELFGSDGNNRGYFISKGNGKKKLSGLTNDYYYGSNGFSLIGWIR